MFINTRSGLRTAAHISYLLGVLSIVLAMSLSLVNFPVAAQTPPSLTADGDCSGSCTSLSATFTNGGGDMPSAVAYDVLFRQAGSWVRVGGGSLGPLASGESQTVSYNPNNVSGNYRFQVTQPEGYEGSRRVSSTCKIECVLPSPTPQQPTNTPTFTNTPVIPTNTPEVPTLTPGTATPQEPTLTPQQPTTTPATPTPQEPTPTPQQPTTTPEEPTATPVTATPQDPTPTPQEPTVTPENPTETPVTTTTPVTATPQEPTPTPQEPGTTPQEPTKEVTKVPPTKVATLGVPAVVDDPGVLIPVTGGDMTPLSPLEAAQKVVFNLGLGFIGLGLVLQGLRRRF